MIERASTNSKRRKRTDNFHLALVVECGGMRSVAAGGFMRVLSESRLLDSFDTLHGSSSGACAAAYFLSQQIEEGRKIYLEDICNRRVVNPWRILSQPCMVDTDYIVDEIFSKKRQLDAERIVSEPGVLNIVTTSVADGLPVVHNNFSTKDEVFRALKATLRLPGPFEPGIEIHGRRHLDGGLAAPIPMFSAIEAGATHILTICTRRSQDYALRNNESKLGALVLRLLYSAPLSQAYVAANAANRQSWNIDRRSTVKIDTLVRPEGASACGWFTIEKSTLRHVEQESIKVATAYLKESAHVFRDV